MPTADAIAQRTDCIGERGERGEGSAFTPSNINVGAGPVPARKSYQIQGGHRTRPYGKKKNDYSHS